MARAVASRKKKNVKKTLLRRGLLGAVVLVGALLAAPMVDRALWRHGERSAIGDSMAAYRDFGCAACHGHPGGEPRWRSDGSAPGSREAITDAVVNGRAAVPGFPAAMPAYGSRVSDAVLHKLTSAVSVLAGPARFPAEPELQIGREIALEMGCFACHGPAGAGGVPNRYSRGGEVPGFYGVAFAETAAGEGGIEEVIRVGRAAERAWWMPTKRPSLDMPAYGDRLDSVETALLIRYLHWLTAEDEIGSE